MTPVGAPPIAPDLMASTTCTATAKSTGKRCVQPVTPPATVCRFHGGAAPQVRDAVERRRQAQRTEALVKTYGGPVDAPADEVLSDLIATAYGHVVWLAAQIAAAASLGEVDPYLIERYDAERTLLARMTKDALGVGIAERQVRLAEDQGRRISTLMRDILADVFAALAQAAADESLTVDVLVRIQREAVPAVVRQRLSEVMEVGGVTPQQRTARSRFTASS